MNIRQFTVNPFEENCYVVWDDKSNEAAIIDPGMMRPQEIVDVDDFIGAKGLVVKYVLLTHCHVDHAASAMHVAEKFNAGIYAHLSEKTLAKKLPDQSAQFGLYMDVPPVSIDHYCENREVLPLGGENIIVLFTPGHSPGGLTYYLPDSGAAFVGDSIFMMSIGRTDLWGGDELTLLRSIRTQIMELPRTTALYPGHGPATSVQGEMEHNPFLL